MSKLLKGAYVGDYIGSIIGVTKGHAKSIDYRTYVSMKLIVFGGYPKY